MPKAKVKKVKKTKTKEPTLIDKILSRGGSITFRNEPERDGENSYERMWRLYGDR